LECATVALGIGVRILLAVGLWDIDMLEVGVGSGVRLNVGLFVAVLL
jgi:hypothetical protein